MKDNITVIGNTTVKILNNEPNEEKIKQLYDLCNILFYSKRECFYEKDLKNKDIRN